MLIWCTSSFSYYYHSWNGCIA